MEGRTTVETSAETTGVTGPGTIGGQAGPVEGRMAGGDRHVEGRNVSGFGVVEGRNGGVVEGRSVSGEGPRTDRTRPVGTAPLRGEGWRRAPGVSSGGIGRCHLRSPHFIQWDRGSI